jgi:uncharacterized protein YjbI with pentapeptide repeats
MVLKLLKSRWQSAADKGSLLEVLTRNINRSVFFEKSPFDLIDDYVDFRGVDFNRQRIRNVVFKKIDFSFSTFDAGRIESSTFYEAKFESVDFSNIVDVGNEFRDCIFKNCKFNRAGLGYSGTKFINCSFAGCNFSKAVFIRGEFNLCTFSDCKLKGVDFNASSFENCTFIGKVEEVWFRGGFALSSDIKEFGVAKENKMKNVSFSNAILIDVTFSNNCNLSSIILPTSGQYFLFDNWLNRLEKLKETIAGWPKEQKVEGEIFANSYLVHAKSQDWYILGEKDVQNALGIEVAQKTLTALRNV